MKGFGKKILQLRQSKGISQQDLAKLLEITAEDVELLEKDQLEPTGETYRRLSVCFEVPLKELVDYKEDGVSQQELDNYVVGKCVKCGKPITEWEDFGVKRYSNVQMDFCSDCKKESIKADLVAKEKDYAYTIKKGFKRATLLSLLVLILGGLLVALSKQKTVALIVTLVAFMFTFAFVCQLPFRGYVAKKIKKAKGLFGLTKKIFSLIYVEFWKNFWRVLFGTIIAISTSFIFVFDVILIILISPFTFVRTTASLLDERQAVIDYLDALSV